MEDVRVGAINGLVSTGVAFSGIGGRVLDISEIDKRSDDGLIGAHEILAGFDDGVVGCKSGIGGGSEEGGDLGGGMKEGILRLVGGGDDGEDENSDDEKSKTQVPNHNQSVLAEILRAEAGGSGQCGAAQHLPNPVQI